jgi:hypothetical protein
MEECLIKLNKGEDADGCLIVCDILKWSATVQGRLPKRMLLNNDAITHNELEPHKWQMY